MIAEESHGQQEIGDVNIFLKSFKQRIKDISFKKWLSKIQGSPKSFYYKDFKSLLEAEKYLSID